MGRDRGEEGGRECGVLKVDQSHMALTKEKESKNDI